MNALFYAYNVLWKVKKNNCKRAMLLLSVKFSAVTLKNHLSVLTSVQFSSVQSLSHVWLFATPWTAACQATLSITNSRNLLRLMSIESVMPSNHLILRHPLLLPPSVFPSIRVFSNESVLGIRWPNIGVQLQHQSFQWIFRTDFL